ncbi:HPP family-domain-containing protein [Leucosporidium creatinivorum]|uniref:HPP family-domain-containing protein n=1 Tax=Leucosporidium creatinivorum TaxID=106004 RepID=A0A1Y2EN66_9BASI|nr:HPP family-domain-containing protein [Leucosporidium creatinivorum]
MLQTLSSTRIVSPAAAAPTPPSFPPPLAPAATSRRTFKREPSASPARLPSSSGASGRRFSHSRGRPPTVGGSSLSRERSRSLSVGGGAPEWEEQGRSRSESGSRAPLWRSRGKDGVQVSVNAVQGSIKTSRRSPLSRFPPIIAHFLGYRPTPSPVSSPIIPFLRHLSPQLENLLLTFIGTLVSILLSCAISNGLSLEFAQVPLAFGSLGATAVLLFAAPEGPLSQPRHLLGGHIISALVGVCISYIFSLSPAFIPTENADGSSFSHLIPVAAALSVSISVLLMQVTKTVHPPGGATALIAAFRPDFMFVLLVFLSIITMGAWACVIGNLGRRRYPVYWWAPDEPVQGGPAAPIGDDDEGGLGAVGEEEEEEDLEQGAGAERERGRKPRRHS